MAQGLTNKEVAEKLYISDNTVKYHMKNILDKLHLQNRAQVVAWVARHNRPPPSCFDRIALYLWLMIIPHHVCLS